MTVANSMKLSQENMVSNYKGWLYVWCVWSSQPKKGMRILDAGPGGKFFILKNCSEIGCDTHAIDLKKKSKKLKAVKNLKYISGNLFSTGYPSSYFDVIYNVSVLEHIELKNRGKFFKEMERILKPSGKLYVTTVDSQRVLTGVNEELKNGMYIPVPLEYMAKPKGSLFPIKTGDFIKSPSWEDNNVIWARHGGRKKNKQWTEFCTILEKRVG